ncbi:MAG: AMP-binding protein [Gemmatimonadaceae bacterium]
MHDNVAAFDVIRWWARLEPDRSALVDRVGQRSFSYGELDADADRWAARLRALGVTAGDRVAVLATNRPELVSLLFACGRCGAALVPLNWRLAQPELAAVLADASPALVVAEARFGKLRATCPEVKWMELEVLASRAPMTTTAAPSPPARLEDAAMILYTSGSTGTPKGAIVSHRQILFNAIATATAWQLGPDDIAPITTPFFHTGGWNVFALPIWSRGGTVVLFDGFDSVHFLDALAQEGCTVAFGVPTQLVMLIESASWGRALPALRWFISGGAPCPPAVAAQVREAGYQLREGFGMTEFGPNCFATTNEAAVLKAGSVGWPAPFVETRVVDDANEEVGPGVVGELWLRGPQLFSGYLGDAARTADVMTPEGWLRTGDLVERDEDGAYRIRGRRKHMFISGGENVYPGEVEAALCECDGVAEAVVIGVPHARWGEVGHAFVLPREHAQLDVGVLLASVRSRIASYKVPKAVTIVQELPRTAALKLDRKALERGLHGSSTAGRKQP